VFAFWIAAATDEQVRLVETTRSHNKTVLETLLCTARAVDYSVLGCDERVNRRGSAASVLKLLMKIVLEIVSFRLNFVKHLLHVA
jgi:hypothetical protein